MKRLLLLGLFLSACAAAPSIRQAQDAAPTPAVDWSIQEAQRVIEAQHEIDAATARAQVEATRAAVSTQDRLATEQALADVLTVAAVTQQAEKTHAAQTPTAAAVNLKMTQGADAIHLQARQTEIYLTLLAAKEKRDGEGWAAFWFVVRAFGIVTIGIWAYYYRQRQIIDRDVYHEVEWLKVEAANAKKLIAQAEAIKANTITIENQPYLITPEGYRRLMPAAIEIATPEQPNQAQAQRMRAAIKMIVGWGVELGRMQSTTPQFGERDLCIYIVNPDGTPNVAGYRRIKGALYEMGVWQRSGRDVVWGPGWSVERFDHEFDLAPLPDSLTGDPPIVLTTLRGYAINAVSQLHSPT